MDMDKIIELGQRLQGLLKDINAEGEDYEIEQRAGYNDAIGDVVDYLFRLADAPPQYKTVRKCCTSGEDDAQGFEFVTYRVLPEIPLRR